MKNSDVEELLKKIKEENKQIDEQSSYLKPTDIINQTDFFDKEPPLRYKLAKNKMISRSCMAIVSVVLFAFVILFTINANEQSNKAYYDTSNANSILCTEELKIIKDAEKGEELISMFTSFNDNKYNIYVYKVTNVTTKEESYYYKFVVKKGYDNLPLKFYDEVLLKEGNCYFCKLNLTESDDGKVIKIEIDGNFRLFKLEK